MKRTTGQRLLEYMAQMGIRQADIVAAVQPYCERHGVKLNRSDISQYVTGKTEPRQEKLMLLSEALNVDVAWLMGYDVPMRPIADPQAGVTGVSLDEAQQDGLHALTEEEAALIAAYRQAEPIYQIVARELLETHPRKA